MQNFGESCDTPSFNKDQSVCQNIPNCPMDDKEKKVRTLTSLKPGEKGKILRLVTQGAIRRRMIDMGILPEVEVIVESIAPLGDPIKIKMKGYYLTLRKKEAEGILLKNPEVANP